MGDVSMFIWTKESIQLFKNAAEYNQYHEFLRTKFQCFIGKDDTVLDLGCGLGYLTLKLAPECQRITAMDVDQDALAVLRGNKSQYHLDNIEVVQQDWTEISADQKWDVVVVCFFGQLRRDLDAFINLCNKKVIAVVANGNDPHFLPKNMLDRHKDKAEDLKNFLSKRYKVESYEQATIAFGQPFVSYDEAYAFVKHYRPKNDHSDIQAHLEKYLVSANQPPYQYELPNQKEIGIFVIEKQ